MAKNGKGVSGKTHTKAQLDDYANQHNPNNKAYQADKENRSKKSRRKKTTGSMRSVYSTAKATAGVTTN